MFIAYRKMTNCIFRVGACFHFCFSNGAENTNEETEIILLQAENNSSMGQKDDKTV